jgi:hypothetical protein
LQLTDGESPGPGHSGGHENHPGRAATRLTFDFQRCFMVVKMNSEERNILAELIEGFEALIAAR